MPYLRRQLKIIKQLALALYLCNLSLANAAQINTDNTAQLPELGDGSSSLFSLESEYQLGRAWLMSFRSQVKTVDDPMMQEYIEHLIYHIASYSELKDRRLDVVIVDNPTINAFAVPGGVIGINSGLLIHAETEAQLITVLAHELAHLSQRHFSRSIEKAKRDSLSNMAGMLAAVVLAANGSGDAAIAAITASQAASLQNKLRYSRNHEQEADRIGMQTMIRADVDPYAAATMFENMLKNKRFSGTRPPEFLLTHPVTEKRISDSLNRARFYPRKVYTENLDYQLMRSRAELSFIRNNREAVKTFRAKLAGNSYSSEASQYGLILSLIRDGELAEAKKLLSPLLEANPEQVAYILAASDIEQAENQLENSVNRLENALALTPDNYPLSMALTKALLKSGQAYQAETILEKQIKLRPNSPEIWYLLAETYGLAGNILGVHQARAEYFVLNGVLDKATQQLSYALPLTKNSPHSEVVIKERIKQINGLKERLKNL